MHPKILELGPFTIYTYGLLLATAFLVGLSLASRLASKDGIKGELVWNLGLLVIVSALVGAKLFMFLSDFNYYRHNPGAMFSITALRSGGVFYGGLLFALGASAWYLRRHSLPGWKVADAFAPGIAIGHAIGRLGCLAAGCCYGKPTDLPWAVTFEDRFAHESIGVPLGSPLHPTQLYEFAAELLITVALLSLRRRRRFSGQLILAYLILYSIARFAVEFYRGDERGPMLAGVFSISQVIAFCTLIVSALLYMRRSSIGGPSRNQPQL